MGYHPAQFAPTEPPPGPLQNAGGIVLFLFLGNDPTQHLALVPPVPALNDRGRPRSTMRFVHGLVPPSTQSPTRHALYFNGGPPSAWGKWGCNQGSKEKERERDDEQSMSTSPNKVYQGCLGCWYMLGMLYTTAHKKQHTTPAPNASPQYQSPQSLFQRTNVQDPSTSHKPTGHAFNVRGGFVLFSFSLVHDDVHPFVPPPRFLFRVEIFQHFHQPTTSFPFHVIFRLVLVVLVIHKLRPFFQSRDHLAVGDFVEQIGQFFQPPFLTIQLSFDVGHRAMLLDPFNAVANTTVSWWNSEGVFQREKKKLRVWG